MDADGIQKYTVTPVYPLCIDENKVQYYDQKVSLFRRRQSMTTVVFVR